MLANPSNYLQLTDTEQSALFNDKTQAVPMQWTTHPLAKNVDVAEGTEHLDCYPSPR